MDKIQYKLFGILADQATIQIDLRKINDIFIHVNCNVELTLKVW